MLLPSYIEYFFFYGSRSFSYEIFIADLVLFILAISLSVDLILPLSVFEGPFQALMPYQLFCFSISMMVKYAQHENNPFHCTREACLGVRLLLDPPNIVYTWEVGLQHIWGKEGNERERIEDFSLSSG